jgi:hypothetical protein
MPKSSFELAQKAAGYMLASANASKREQQQQLKHNTIPKSTTKSTPKSTTTETKKTIKTKK